MGELGGEAKVVDHQSTHDHMTRGEAEELARRMQSVAASQAQLDHDFCVMVERFDSGDALAHFHGIKSTAHFVAWACSMSAGAAREHVRVARVLPSMPQVAAAFREGRLTYSKVRELTRVAGLVDEDELLRLALEMTASQLARTVAAYRRCAGSRMAVQHKRRFTTHTLHDGMVRITAVLPPEEAGLVTAAVENAARAAQCVALDELDERLPATAETDRAIIRSLGDVPAGTPPTPPDRVQGLLDVAASYLDGQAGEPSDDHTLVVVEVSAEQLDAGAGVDPVDLDKGKCHVVGHGAIEPATAQRLTCTSRILPVLMGESREVLKLGRTVRLATRSQRRALRIRDAGVCQFPGCHQTRHLDAHHIVAWSQGGPTNLDNLVLLCRRHHVQCHEGGLRLELAREGGRRRLLVSLPDGKPITGTWLEGLRVDELDRLIADTLARLAAGEAGPVFPERAGAGFQLQSCVRVLLDNSLEDELVEATLAP